MKCCRLFALSLLSSVCMTSVFAAKPVDLRHQSVTLLQPYLAAHITAAQVGLKEVRRSIDFNQTTHIHLQQMYAGNRIWGGDSIIHIPKGGNTALAAVAANKNATMNGLLYQGVENDLGAAPVAAQMDHAIQAAVKQYQRNAENKQRVISDNKAELMVFVDKVNKAHWTYLVSFLATPVKGLPEKPTMIMDATTFEVYQQWNDIQTLEDVNAGGFGGNEKEGEFTYDGLMNDYPALTMQRDAITKMCFVENEEVTVQDNAKGNKLMEFACEEGNADHGNEYWNGSDDAVNGGFSPTNDALFVGKVVQRMYRNWYGIPALVDSQGKPMMLVMRVHADMDNAYWDGSAMTFGDGITMFYPLVSLGVGAHEISHGFTQQHSNLAYYSQSGGLNESFSDMAAQAAEYYANKHSSWQIGSEIMKGDGALRYMDEPTKDCYGKAPGSWCSISNMKDYYEGLDVHFSSGIFNKAFYLMGSEQGWNDTREAFDVMVKANRDYWTSTTSFHDAACGVLSATTDYDFDKSVVLSAFAAVGITDLDNC